MRILFLSRRFPPVRLGYVTETNWPRGTRKTPYQDQAKHFRRWCPVSFWGPQYEYFLYGFIFAQHWPSWRVRWSSCGDVVCPTFFWSKRSTHVSIECRLSNYSKQSHTRTCGLRTSWRKFANLIPKNTRTCLADQDQAGSYIWVIVINNLST